LLQTATSTCEVYLKKYNSATSGTTFLLYYIIGYMFRPIHRSSSGLLLFRSEVFVPIDVFGLTGK